MEVNSNRGEEGSRSWSYLEWESPDLRSKVITIFGRGMPMSEEGSKVIDYIWRGCSGGSGAGGEMSSESSMFMEEC